MRISKIILIALVLCLVSTLSISCGSDSDATAVTEGQIVTVQRGDLTIDITAVGNLAFAYEEKLTFGISGTVEEVLVEVGDSVKEEQVVAKLDDASVISLQKAVSQAEINLEQARINLRDAEENLEETQNPYTELDIAQAEAAVADANIALETAQEALEEVDYTESDIAQAELAVINATIALDTAQDNFERAEEKYKLNRSVKEREWNYQQKQRELTIAEFNLTEAEDNLAEMNAGADPLEVEQKQKQLAVAQANLEKAEDDLTEIQAWIEGNDTDSQKVALKQSEMANAQAALNVDTAQVALDEAAEQLEMAILTAPFNGIVISVNVEAGEEVNANQVVITLVDPDEFEAEILVSEIDILNMQVGAEASIQVDAIAGISLPAEVTFISPTATIQQGVVNYSVKVEIQSLEAAMQERQEARQKVIPELSSEELSEKIKQALEAGLITQEQAEAMIEQKQKSGAPFSQEDRPSPAMTPENFQLREGLTVTVSIIVDERHDVLLVPNSAITSSSGQAYVKVVSSDGVTEDRLVITGISDWQYTEIVEGLNEGDKVIIPKTTSTSTTPTEQEEKPGGRFMPPGGGFNK